MTDELGPGEEFSPDLSTLFDAYRVSAAGLASERGHDELAALLGGEGTIEACFAEYPVTSEGGRSLASVDVVLRVPGEGARGAADDDLLAGYLDEVVEPDGYHVRTVRVEPA